MVFWWLESLLQRLPRRAGEEVKMYISSCRGLLHVCKWFRHFYRCEYIWSAWGFCGTEKGWLMTRSWLGQQSWQGEGYGSPVCSPRSASPCGRSLLEPHTKGSWQDWEWLEERAHLPRDLKELAIYHFLPFSPPRRSLIVFYLSQSHGFRKEFDSALVSLSLFIDLSL